MTGSRFVVRCPLCGRVIPGEIEFRASVPDHDGTVHVTLIPHVKHTCPEPEERVA